MLWSKIAKVLFVCVCFSLSIGQFSAIFKSDGLSLYLFDVCVAIFAGFGLFHIFVRKLKLRLDFGLIALLLFVLWGLVSLGFNFYIGTYNSLELVSALFYPVRLLVYLMSAITVMILVHNKIISMDFVHRTFLVFGVVVFLAGLVQLVVLPDFTVLDSTLGWDPHKHRMTSTFFDPNFLGMYFVILLGVIQRAGLKSKNLKLFLASSFVVGVVLTFSRSAWGALAVLAVIVGLRYRKLLLVSILMLFLAYFSVPRIQMRLAGITDPADSAAFRIVSWRNATEVFQDNLILGAGFNFFRYVQKDYGFFEYGASGGNSGAGADSSLLFVLAVTGILGFVMFSSYFIFYSAGFCSRRDYVSLGVLAALVLNSFFINSLFYPQILFLYLVSFGLMNASNSKTLVSHK